MRHKVFDFLPPQRIPIVLAPMAGYTDLAQRIVCHEHGADAMWSEMVNARSLLEKNPRGLALLATELRDRPLVVQIFGGDPDCVAEAVRWVVEHVKPAAIDLNFGCPVKKVARAGAGAILMKEPERIGEIVRSVRAAFDGVLSIKIRKGWGGDSVTAPWVVERAADWGVDLLMLHPRLATQMYGGLPDWELAARCRGLTDLPLFASGNVVDGSSALRILECTGFDGLAVGRGAVGDPAIFARLRAVLEGKGEPPMPTPAERIAMARRHFELVLELTGGDPQAYLWQRKTLVRYFRGFRGVSEARKALTSMEGNQAVLDFLDRIVVEEELPFVPE